MTLSCEKCNAFLSKSGSCVLSEVALFLKCVSPSTSLVKNKSQLSSSIAGANCLAQLSPDGATGIFLPSVEVRAMFFDSRRHDLQLSLVKCKCFPFAGAILVPARSRL